MHQNGENGFSLMHQNGQKKKKKTFKIDTPNWLVNSVCCSAAWAFQQIPDQPMCLNQHVSCLCLRSSQATVLTVCGDDCTLETQDIGTTPEKEKSEDGLPLVVERQRETVDVDASDIHLDVAFSAQQEAAVCIPRP